jgi:hypothetical protein
MYGTEITIAINDLNDGPTDIVLENNGVYENQPGNTLVGYLHAIDPDAGDTFTYAFAAGAGDTDNGRFAISGNMLLTDEVFDYETATNYSVRISAEDSGGAAVTNSFAVFIANVGEIDDPDADGDGMPDWWELLLSGSSTGLVASADDDGDGVSNLKEWIAGTGADDYSSMFVIEKAPEVTSNNFSVIQWMSEAGRVYGLDWTTNLMETWDSSVSNIPATPPMNVYTDTTHTAEGAGFYRIGVRLSK